ncbi:hypothetical protein [Ligilactobacillus saerimneri]|uniref:hypothetical protein n=1 Tax=Ligilactobacillus saerimneri TaxID=228229 RepID=UPI002943A0D5|nr:hypothetical protein [Ligilactobacillus saerimneri]
MDGQYYVLTTANRKMFIEDEINGRELIFTDRLIDAGHFNDLSTVQRLANRYGLIAYNVNLMQRFDCGVWKS